MKFFSALSSLFRNIHIRSKLLFLLIFATLFPAALIFCFFSGRFYQMIVSDTLRQEQEATAKTAPGLDAVLEDVVRFSDGLSETAFFKSEIDGALPGSVSDLLTGEAAVSLEDYIDTEIESGPVSGVRLYIDLSKDDAAFRSLPADSTFQSMDSVSAVYWNGIFYSAHPSSIFCPPFYLSDHERTTLGDCAYIRPIYIRTHAQDMILCYLACYFQSQDLVDQMQKHLSKEGSVSYIANDRDSLIATTDSTLSGIYYLDYDFIKNNLMRSNGFLERSFHDSTVYLSCYYLPEANWFLVTVIPSEPLRRNAYSLFIRSILLILVVLVICMILAGVMADSFIRPIEALSRTMQHVQDAPPVPMPETGTQDETGQLIHSYNLMTRKIQDLMEQQKESLEQLRAAEFHSLQAQINPHFLYNTMDMIGWMAKEGRTDEVFSVVHDLSAFYRLTLSRKSSISTLSQEIEHITIYVRIQNMRFDQGISLVVDIPDELMDAELPKLTLQPLVENSILHGILEKEERKGTIVLTGWEEGNDVVLLLTDDGVGMDKAKLAALRTSMEAVDVTNHLAVANTNRRLKILYGNLYGLKYKSEPGHGTEVTIRVPSIRE